MYIYVYIYIYIYIYIIASTQTQRTAGSANTFEHATTVAILNFTAHAISQTEEKVDELLSAAGTPVQSWRGGQWSVQTLCY
jgi:hypothetical protein